MSIFYGLLVAPKVDLKSRFCTKKTTHTVYSISFDAALQIARQRKHAR